MPRSINRVAPGCLLLALLAAAGGCQKKPSWNLGMVEGTVSKGGRPLAHIQVVFLADTEAGTEGVRASAVTDEAGHYQVRTDIGEQGAVVGKNRVLLQDLAGLTMSGGKKGRKGSGPKLPEGVELPKGQSKKAANPQRVPNPYWNFKDTPLRVDVHPGPQTLDFDIP